MRAIAAALFLCAYAGCSGQPDACAGIGSSCLTLEVTGPNITIDSLRITGSAPLSATKTSTFTPHATLPVRVGIVPPAGVTATVTFTVDALANGVVLATGTSQPHDLVLDDRATIRVVLHGASDDMGFSQDAAPDAAPDASQVGPGDMANTDASAPRIVPHEPATQSMFDIADLGAVETTGTTVVIDTDTGAVTNLRAANSVPKTWQTIGGIAFGSVPTGDTTSGIFVMKSLKIDSGSTLVVYGSGSLTIVAQDTIEIDGTIDARAYDQMTGMFCAPSAIAAGGSPGCVHGTNATCGQFAGSSGNNFGAAGAGGGASGTGGPGGAGKAPSTSTAGGGPAPTQTFDTIIGGSGGGAGWFFGTMVGKLTAAAGGAGGGAVQLVARNKMVLGSALINASGCGGGACTDMTTPGGGGAGGTILLEASEIAITGSSLVANGGGGGGGMVGGVSVSAAGATGGAPGSACVAGGAGSAGAGLDGGAGKPGMGTMSYGGGGGGAAGYIGLFSMNWATTQSCALSTSTLSPSVTPAATCNPVTLK